jgi:hypothetical protein
MKGTVSTFHTAQYLKMLATKSGTQANVAIKHKNYTTMHEE